MHEPPNCIHVTSSLPPILSWGCNPTFARGLRIPFIRTWTSSIKMDPLSVGASVLAFIGLADRIISLCKYCIDGVQDAPSDIRMIHGEASSLRAIVDVLTETEAPSLFEKDGPFEACRHCLSELEGLLPAGTNSGHARRLRPTLAELAWPLKQSKARKLLAELSHHKSTLLLIISGDIV